MTELQAGFIRALFALHQNNTGIALVRAVALGKEVHGIELHFLL